MSSKDKQETMIRNLDNQARATREAEALSIVRTPVDSRNLKSYGYSIPLQRFIAEFHNGALYQYFNVPQAMFDEFEKAESKGSFFNMHISRSFDYQQVKQGGTDPRRGKSK